MLGKIVELIKSKILLIVIVIVVLVVFIWIMSLISNNLKGGNSYEKVMSTMENAARKYYSDRPNELPKVSGKNVVVKDKELVSLNYMKNINDILKDDNASCKGEVSVTNINDNYKYRAKLDCGDKYKTVDFVSKIKDISTVESGNGLYNLNGALVFRGEYVDNYVTIGKKLYRILKVVDDKVYLIFDSKLDSVSWDDRYNIEKDSKAGINDYSISRIKEKLEALYNSDELFTAEDKLMISTQTLNIGKRKIDDIDVDGSIEKSNTIDNQYLGLPTVNDYINASVDSNCKKATDISCTNYNYLANCEYGYWMLTADANTTYKVYRFSTGSGVNLTGASSNAYIRPVFALTSDILYVSGDGTIDNPYVIK